MILPIAGKVFVLHSVDGDEEEAGMSGTISVTRVVTIVISSSSPFVVIARNRIP